MGEKVRERKEERDDLRERRERDGVGRGRKTKREKGGEGVTRER